MAKHNYSAWHIDPSTFSDSWDEVKKLHFFARYAILAPSGHNTQPWQFAYKGQALVLKANHARHLPYSGLKANEPYVSLGSCLGVLELAAKGFGYSLSVTYLKDKDAVAKIALGKKIPADSSLLSAITARVSNRQPYETQNLPNTILQPLMELAPKDVSLRLVSSREEIAYIAEKTVQATYATMGDKAFRLELSKWVRNNLTKQYDGMPGFTQGIPTPPSLLARHIIKNIDVSKDQAKKDSSRVLNSANLMIISIKNDSREALLNAGKTYAQICVLAQQQGIATTGVGAAVIDTATKEEVARDMKLAGQPVAIIRLGKTAKSVRHTPRWHLKALTV